MYDPLVVSLAETREPLFLVNRSGKRPSAEGAAERFDRARTLCRDAGFRRITFHGDTDFSETQHLDRWDADDVRFVFGYDASPNLIALADAVPRGMDAVDYLLAYEVQTEPRQRAGECEGRHRRGARLQEFAPGGRGGRRVSISARGVARRCRMVVVRRMCRWSKATTACWISIGILYLTDDQDMAAAQVVFLANDRCQRGSLIEQLEHGVGATQMPVDALLSDWAYMVMAALAWTLEAWLRCACGDEPLGGRCAAEKPPSCAWIETFLHALVLIRPSSAPSRRLVFRLLAWSPWQAVFLRGFDGCATPRRD